MKATAERVDNNPPVEDRIPDTINVELVMLEEEAEVFVKMLHEHNVGAGGMLEIPGSGSVCSVIRAALRRAGVVVSST